MSNAKRQTPAALKGKTKKKTAVSAAHIVDAAATKLSNIKLLFEYAAASTLPEKVRAEAREALIKAGYMAAPKNYWNMKSSGGVGGKRLVTAKSTLQVHLSNVGSKLVPQASGKRKSARHFNTDRTITNFARQKRIQAAAAAERRMKKSPPKKSPPKRFGTINNVRSPPSP